MHVTMQKGEFLVAIFVSMTISTDAAIYNVPVPSSADCTPHYPSEKLTGKYLEAELEVLRSAGWEVNDVGGELVVVKEFVFHSFERAYAFMTDVSLQAVYACHHPKLTITTNRIRATLTSKQAQGITKNDVAMAHFMDNEFQLFE